MNIVKADIVVNHHSKTALFCVDNQSSYMLKNRIRLNENGKIALKDFFLKNYDINKKDELRYIKQNISLSEKIILEEVVITNTKNLDIPKEKKFILVNSLIDI